MDANTFLKVLPIGSPDCDTLTPASPFRSNMLGDLYCGWCLHDIRSLSRMKTGVICADCGQNIDITSPSFIHETPSTTTPDPLGTNAFAVIEG